MAPERTPGWRGLLMAGIVVWVGSGCSERTPTSIDPSLLPDEPVTAELLIPWSDFGLSLATYGGYGAPSEMGEGLVALDFGDSLNARTLVRPSNYPTSTQVQDTSGTTRTDSDLTFIGGRVVARFDTIGSVQSGSVLLAVAATQVDWHGQSATWTLAADTIGGSSAWPEAGGGPVTRLDTATWDPAAGDTVSFGVDSATVAALGDTARVLTGLRLEALTPGVRLEVRSLQLRLTTRPSINPDTLVEVSPVMTAFTFLYDPVPTAPAGGIRVGGVPAWRTILGISAPDTLDGPPELCAVVGCPAALDPDRLNYAALLLRTSASPAAYQPTDTVRIELRPVLSPGALPKSPLGAAIIPSIRALQASQFTAPAATVVELPITDFVRDLIRGETSSGGVPPSSLALISTFEPLSFPFASFYGPGTPEEPVLRLLVTVGGSVTR